MSEGTATIALPAQDALTALLTELLGRGCAVAADGPGLQLDGDSHIILATYVDNDGQIGAVAVGDLAFACRSGSALVMTPSEQAEEALETGEIDEEMLDCYREVANILSRLMNSSSTPHVRLGRLYRSGDLLPGTARTLLRDAVNRQDFAVSINEYGDGRLTIVGR